MQKDHIDDILMKYGQEHLVRFWDMLSEEERSILSEQIDAVNWGFLDSFRHSECDADGVIEPISALTLDEIEANKVTYLETGLQAIRDGKVCALLLAGGQGTRLGYEHPKGTFNIGQTKDMYIFELLMEHTLDVVKQAEAWIPFYIMTSEENHDETVAFFEEHNYFGYEPKHVHFYVQEMNPATDFEGRVLMNTKYTLAQSPNGNGGWFASLYKAGLLDGILEAGIEWINIFSVDNVLQRIMDPVFLGATIEAQAMCGAKVVVKAAPEEKVGAICLRDGKPHIVEYYELDDEMMYQTTEDGKLAYGYGVILNYLFPVSRLTETLGQDMPLHVVKKKVPYVDEQGELVTPDAVNGLKFETLALDLIHEMDSCLVFEVVREKEFAPVKNKEGVDSIDSARELLVKNGYIL